MKFENKIKINVNGKKLVLNENDSISKLIKKLKIPLNKVAIELNKKIIDKKKINKIKVKNNDNIEIVHFIGGG
jgi:thiamine biosynthesis protein ThiS